MAHGADDTSADAVASASGRFVAFESDASDLVGNDKNGSTPDVFRRGLLRWEPLAVGVVRGTLR